MISYVTYDIRQLASLTGQCRQVYCLVEMAPSAPSWRPPHQRGEFDGFPGRREGPNQCRHTRSFQAFSTYPVLRRSRRRRIAPSDPSLNQPSRQSPAACPEWPNSSRTFTNLNNSLNREPNEWQNKWIDISSPIGILNQNFAENNELSCAESEFSKRGTRNWLLGADIATDQTKPSNTEVSPRKVFRSNHRRRVAPSDPSLIKPSGQIQVVRPEKPKRSKTSINPNISLNIEPKGW